tara:strand:+ start:4251 stop:5813 length:1563 start_codon:yes stop_codon:yes gene_type:complete
MRKITDHIKNLSTPNKISKTRSKVLRSSAIFPCNTNKFLDTKILFMGYWMIKKNIKKILMNYKLRDQYGKMLISKTTKINKIKAYSISTKNLLHKHNINENFLGSLEVEFLSKEDLVFPFPACVINMDYKGGSSFVHTIGRIYNDKKDFLANSKIKVAESGFDIIPNKNFYPFISFVNGRQILKNQLLKIRIINSRNEYFIKKIDLSIVRPFETKFIQIMNEDEKKFLLNKKGTCIIDHNLSGFYPRFLAGNYNNKKTKFSVTHSYYDTKKIKENFKNPNKKDFFDATLVVPIFKKKYLTEISLYPIYSSNNFNLNLELFKNNGEKIFTKKNFFKSKENSLKFININNKIKEIDLMKFKENHFIAKISFDSKKSIPTRLKFGLNIISKDKLKAVSSNVCFNAQAAFKYHLERKTRFCWTPIVNKNNSKFIIYNSSFVKKGFKKASILMNFWREKDDKSISKKMVLNDNGSYLFDLNKNNKIKKFLGSKSGWVTFKSNNPFIQGYYLETSKEGDVGADHFF